LVAGFAIAAVLVAVLHREFVHLQLSGRPGIGPVAVLAFQAEETSVDRGLSVAAHAFSGRAGVTPCSVTILAGDLCVLAL
jgi:hypothetical protein